MTPPTAPPTESVWDYPRPPRLEPTPARLRIVHRGIVLADTTHALRVLETSHPPVYYIPPADLAMQYLKRSPMRSSFCEFKGSATYWTIEVPTIDPAKNPGAAYLDFGMRAGDAARADDALRAGDAARVPDAAWSYANPSPRYAALRDHLAFYASRVDECTVDGERVQAQPGDFYGGWITSGITGPFKGPPGTMGW